MRLLCGVKAGWVSAGFDGREEMLACRVANLGSGQAGGCPPNSWVPHCCRLSRWPVSCACRRRNWGHFCDFLFLNIQFRVFRDQCAICWSRTRSLTVLHENSPSSGCDSLEAAGVARSRAGVMGRTGPVCSVCSPCSPSWAWRTTLVFSSDALQQEIFHSLCAPHVSHRAEVRGVECRLLMGSFLPETPGEYEKSN